VMDGEIGVNSTPGSGSTFTARLPVRHTASDRAERHSASGTAPTGPVVLAVDDNPVGLTVLRHALERHHLEVHCAASAREALEAAARRRYDLVLMDLQMPEMDGLAAARELRKVPGYETVPILALTATSSDEVRELCRAHGFEAFLSKPVESVELWAVVSRHLKSGA
jgi:two-component system, sensor histidine kinase and response regulator